MDYEFRQISDYGSSNPIVARLTIQSGDLLKAFSVEKHKKDQILNIMMLKIQPKLLECYKIYDELYKRLKEIGESVKKYNLAIPDAHQARTIPIIINLESKCDNFLYNSKNTLREITQLINCLWDTDFTDPKYNKIVDWAESKNDENPELFEMLKEDHDVWIKPIIEMRNSAEHPYGKSGSLEYENVNLVNTEDGYKFTPPLWNLNNDGFSNIMADIETTIENLLRFSEDLLVIYLTTKIKSDMIGICEIPEDNISKEIPIRLKIVYKDEKLIEDIL